MKRSSFRRHNVSLLSPTIRSVGIIALVVVLLLGLIRLVAPGAFVALVSPLWNLGSSLSDGAGNVADSFGNPRELAEDRDRLLAENLELRRMLEAKDAQIADMGALVGESSTSGLIVSVIARPPVAPYDVLILSGGRADGIAEGLLVYGKGGIPIGVITFVSEHSSRAALFSEAGRETAGWAGESRIPVSLVGKGSGTFSLTVAKDSGLVVGDSVYLPGPGAIPIGTITKIDTDPSSPDAVVHIFPFANPFSITQVIVGPAMLP